MAEAAGGNAARAHLNSRGRRCELVNTAGHPATALVEPPDTPLEQRSVSCHVGSDR